MQVHWWLVDAEDLRTEAYLNVAQKAVIFQLQTCDLQIHCWQGLTGSCRVEIHDFACQGDDTAAPASSELLALLHLPVHGYTMGESKSVSRSKGKLGKVSTQHWLCQSACCLTPSPLVLKNNIVPTQQKCIKQYRTVLTSIYLHVVRGFLKTVFKNIIK